MTYCQNSVLITDCHEDVLITLEHGEVLPAVNASFKDNEKVTDVGQIA